MLKRHPAALYVTWFAALIIAPLPLLLTLNASLQSSREQQLLIASALIAYTWWLCEVFLSTRPQWLDRRIGLPANYFVHSMLGVGALILAFIHRHFMMSMGRWIVLTGDLAWYIVLAGVIYAALFMSGWFVDRIPVAATIKRHLQFIFRHQISLWIHRLNIVVILLIWAHVHLIARINVHLPFMVLFDIYTVAALGCYTWKKFVAPERRLTGRVVSNTPLPGNVRQVIVSDDSATSQFKPGDFFFVTFEAISHEAHPFSVSNNPHDGTGTIVFTIRELGDYTNRIAEARPGTVVRAEGPFGRFAPIIDSMPGHPLVLIGMGTGIAPLISIAQAYHTERKIHVVWTVKRPEERYFDDELHAIEGSNIQSTVQVGRLKSRQLPEMFSRQEQREAAFFIVGGAPAVINVEGMLIGFGIPKDRIIDERLTM